MTYFPHSDQEIKEMLKVIGMKNLSDLKSPIPKEYHIDSLDLELGMTEPELYSYFQDISEKNRNYSSIFMGAGAYFHYIPAALDELVSRQEFYTAYTPYQPEISQGTLRAIFEYQSYITKLTGMDISNASMYDGGTALTEASLMAFKISRKNKVLVDRFIHPEYLEVLRTYLEPLNIDIDIYETDPIHFDIEDFKRSWSSDYACFIISSPNFIGSILDLSGIADIIHNDKSLLIQCISEALSLSIIKKPMDYDVDITCGEAQSFGIPLSFGGPYLGFLACKKEFLRKVPGRLVGQTKDKDNNIVYVLTLSTREQHIRREGATSNICTNHGLCALRASAFLSLIGRNGLYKYGLKNIENSHYLFEEINKLGNFTVNTKQIFFNEFIVSTDIEYNKIRKSLDEANILAFYSLGKIYKNMQNTYILCATELNTKQEIDNLINILKGIK